MPQDNTKVDESIPLECRVDADTRMTEKLLAKEVATKATQKAMSLAPIPNQILKTVVTATATIAAQFQAEKAVDKIADAKEKSCAVNLIAEAAKAEKPKDSTVDKANNRMNNILHQFTATTEKPKEKAVDKPKEEPKKVEPKKEEPVHQVTKQERRAAAAERQTYARISASNRGASVRFGFRY